MNTTSLAYSSDSLSGEPYAEFILQLRSGNAGAFEKLVREFGPRMLAIAKRMLHCESDAADAVQDAFTSAFKNIDGFKGESNIYTWLHRIVVNASLIRLRSRKASVSIDDCLPQFAEDGHHARRVSRSDWDGLQKAESAELRQRVRMCIDQLPPSYREVLVLRDMEGLDTESTARLLDESISNVKIRLHRARQALRTLLLKNCKELCQL